MSQANVSKALNPAESKQFTIDQVFRIAQHFGVSIDDLSGNTKATESMTSPAAVLSYLMLLLCEHKIWFTNTTEVEWVYEPYMNEHGYPECDHEQREIEYTAFYFPKYHSMGDFAKGEQAEEEIHYQFMSGGNESKFKKFNEILNKLLPIAKFHVEGSISKEAFDMVLKGYLEQLTRE